MNEERLKGIEARVAPKQGTWTEFIKLTKRDVPDLCEEIRRLWAEVHKLRALLDGVNITITHKEV